MVVRGAGDGERKDGNDDENRQARPVLPPDKRGGTPCLGIVIASHNQDQILPCRLGSRSKK